MLNGLLKGLTLPSICVVCQQYHQECSALCQYCKTLLTPLGPACIQCAMVLPDDSFLRCGLCATRVSPIDRCYVHWQYKEPLRSLLHQYKYGQSLYLTSFLVDLMLVDLPLRQEQPICLLPVPMHALRLRERGFNHALELTKCLSKRLNLPYESDLLQKTRHTVTQASLGASARQHNLKAAFSIKVHQLTHVALIDDLMTTGSTALELAHILKKSGVEQVEIWVCARAV